VPKIEFCDGVDDAVVVCAFSTDCFLAKIAFDFANWPSIIYVALCRAPSSATKAGCRASATGGETYSTAFCISTDGSTPSAFSVCVVDTAGFGVAVTVIVALEVSPPADATSVPPVFFNAAEIECLPTVGVHEIETMRASAGESTTATLPISSEASLKIALPLNTSSEEFITLA